MKRALVVAVFLGVFGLLADVFAGPFVFFSTRTSEPQLRAGAMIGAIEGIIKRAEADTSTLRMPSGFLGLLSLPVVVTGQTKIVVAEKLGGFGDLEPGRVVRVTYEVVRDRLVARRIDVRDAVSSGAPFAEPKGDEDEKPVAAQGVLPASTAAAAALTTPRGTLAPVAPAPSPQLAGAMPPAPPASLSGARQYGSAAPPAPKRVATPPARPRVTKPKRPDGKTSTVAAKPPATRKEPPRAQ